MPARDSRRAVPRPAFWRERRIRARDRAAPDPRRRRAVAAGQGAQQRDRRAQAPRRSSTISPRPATWSPRRGWRGPVPAASTSCASATPDSRRTGMRALDHAEPRLDGKLIVWAETRGKIAARAGGGRSGGGRSRRASIPSSRCGSSRSTASGAATGSERRGPKPRVATREEVDAAVLKALKKIARRLARGGQMSLTPVERLALLDEPDQLYVLRRLTMPEKRGLIAHYWWHKGQKAPDGDWRICLMLGGRGFGKTRAGAEWVSALARADGRCGSRWSGRRGARRCEVMVEGRAGCSRSARADEDAGLLCRAAAWSSSPAARRRSLYSGDNPDGLRGPEHHFAWCDELAKWRIRRRPGTICMLGLRLGERRAGAGDDDAAADAAAEAAGRRSGDGADWAGATARQSTPAGGPCRGDGRALRRHQARPAGAGRRADRGCRRGAVDAGDDREEPRGK